jgi:hydroxyacylglutathione hydrolase
MELEATPIPAFADNYLWLLHRAGIRSAVVVDPGDAEPVEQFLSEHGLELGAILVTHHHHDHIGGVARLAERRDIPIFAPADARIPLATRRVTEGDQVELRALGASFKVLAVPGHTSSHIAYYGHGLLLCGDTLFAMGCGRLFDGTAGQLMDSLEKIKQLPPATQVCCAHEYTLANAAFALEFEPDNVELTARTAACRALRRAGKPTLPTSLADELATNPFLRVGEHVQLRSRIAAHAETNVDPADRMGCFAALRKLKDGFRPPMEAPG